jgi:hypothetical protein
MREEKKDTGRKLKGIRTKQHKKLGEMARAGLVV